MKSFTTYRALPRIIGFAYPLPKGLPRRVRSRAPCDGSKASERVTGITSVAAAGVSDTVFLMVPLWYLYGTLYGTFKATYKDTYKVTLIGKSE